MRTQIQTEWCVYRVSLTTFLTPAVDLQTTGRVSGLTDIYTIFYFLNVLNVRLFFCKAALKVKLISVYCGKRLALDVNFTALIQ